MDEPRGTNLDVRQSEPAAHPLLVALDIDGTVCVENTADPFAHKTISVPVREAVARAMRTGAHIVLCTGRLAPATLPFLRELRIHIGFAVCSNGAVLLDAGTGDVVERSSFALAQPISSLVARLPGAIFVAEAPGAGVLATGRVDDADMLFGEVRLIGTRELAARSTTRLAVHWPGHSDRELAAALAAADLPGVQSCCYPGESVADLTPAGVTKGSALERLRARLGIPIHRTVAIGDGTNDIDMLTWAAHSVAMGDAPAQVRAAATETCPPAAEDGLATALSRWFPP